MAWAAVGTHPPLREAMRTPTTADALAARRVSKEDSAAESGEAEPRVSEIDVWPLVVAHNIRNTAENPDGHLELIKVAKES